MAQMLGPFLWLLLAVAGAGLVFNLARKEWENIAVLSAGLICSAASLGVMCIAQHRNEFFGLTWQMLLLFSAIFALGTLTPSSVLRTGVVVFALTTGLFKLFGPHGPMIWQPQTDALTSRSLNEALIKRFDIRGDPSFVELAPVTGTGGKIYLFARKGAFRFEERASEAVD
jgi:hypothetical protein